MKLRDIAEEKMGECYLEQDVKSVFTQHTRIKYFNFTVLLIMEQVNLLDLCPVLSRQLLVV